jgi:hypothetical protein
MAVESNQTLSRQLGHYRKWREQLVAKIQACQSWIEQEGLSDGADDLRVYELVEALTTDKLTVAMAGEFSRGKSELINAIFFADHGRRLLPTEAGRTTMCPTELRFDEDTPPCIKLLPIDTRKSSETITEFKQSGTYWTNIAFELDSPKKMAKAFHEIVKSKTVSISEAQELGLYDPNLSDSGSGIDVPLWRHAVINYPHPLLKQGLVILDTPGLNSLGTEPELTMSMLPNAHVVVFVLAADTGVTKSDLQVWQEHVCMAKGNQNEGRLIVLNKIDTLWDELRGASAIDASISRQRQETAAVLGVTKNYVFPVSAQKGLVGKIKQQPELVEKSGLPLFEAKLTEDIVPAKQALIRDKVVQEIGSIVQTAAAIVETRLAATKAELKELKGMSGKNETVMKEMMEKKRQDHEAYKKRIASLENTHKVLDGQIKMLLNHLSIEAFDKLIDKTRKDMKGSWTTHGLKGGMKTFFEGAMRTMAKVAKQTERIKGLVEAIYDRFQVEHGLAKIKLDSFALQPYHNELKRLYKEAEVFRNSSSMVMTEQHFVVKKFFITLVSRARQLFEGANKDAAGWSTAIMAPVFAQLREHKVMMDHRVSNMQKIHKSLNSINGRIKELRSKQQNLERQRKINQDMLAQIKNPALQASQIDTTVPVNDDDDDTPTDRLAITGGVA